MANKIIKTHIVLKNDTEALWIEKNPTLMKGEVGVAIDKNKFKIGDGTSTWNDLAYSGISADEIINIINDNRDNIYTYARTNSDQTDNDAITAALAGATAKKGDICIIKTAIGGSETAFEYMGYVYDGTNWAAMDGNVSSDNVIMSEDILFAGSYTQVGNITKSSSGTTTDKAKGKNLTSLFKRMFTKIIQPTITSNPSCTVTLTNAKAYEVGTTVNTAYTTSFKKGSYSFAPSDTGVTATGWSVSNGTTTLTTATGKFDDITVGDNTNYKLTATATYNAGAVAKDNTGGDSDPVVQIKAGTTASASSSAITGYRGWWTYVGTDNTTEIDSAFVRGATAKGAAGTNFNISNLSIPAGTKRVFVAIPASKNMTLKSVIDVDGMGLDVKENFTTKTVKVNGANGYAAVDYTIYLCENAAGLAATKYTFTF